MLLSQTIRKALLGFCVQNSRKKACFNFKLTKILLLTVITRKQICNSRTMSSSSKKGKSKVKDEKSSKDVSKVCPHHSWRVEDVDRIQANLLAWYDSHQRDLPWRKTGDVDANTRAYAVWVSEIMLQQTQVTTVIDYYNKWMAKWPNLDSLAKATVEEVNSMWSGLGYYSRGRRLLEGAQKVVNEMDGQMPTTAEDLQRHLPGVGRYTACAIASIAFQQVTGLVDGNVMRVLSRLRLIGAFITQPFVIDKFWCLANEIVSNQRPGDFNQAMMELGATVCTPKTPSCSSCPIRPLCHSNEKVEHENNKSLSSGLKSLTNKDLKCEIPDIENAVPGCMLCLPSDQSWDQSAGVTNLPRKPPKAKARQEAWNVLVLKHKNTRGRVGDFTQEEYWMVKRPEKGLLAGLWEFPMKQCLDDSQTKPDICEDFNLDTKIISNIQNCGQLTHLFSHIHHTYRAMSAETDNVDVDASGLNPDGREAKWVSMADMKDAAISTGMRKVFKLYQDQTNQNNSKVSKKRRSEDNGDQRSKKNQPSISAFFKPSGTIK